jgi:hypothetical protein
MFIEALEDAKGLAEVEVRQTGLRLPWRYDFHMKKAGAGTRMNQVFSIDFWSDIFRTHLQVFEFAVVLCSYDTLVLSPNIVHFDCVCCMQTPEASVEVVAHLEPPHLPRDQWASQCSCSHLRGKKRYFPSF